MKKIARTILPVAAVIYALTTAADTLHAQYGILGVIAGQVTDWRGSALPAAHIDVTDRETGQRAAALADADGHYILAGLAADHHYTLQVRCIGFVPRTERDVRAVSATDGARPESLRLTLVPIERNLAATQRGDY